MGRKLAKGRNPPPLIDNLKKIDETKKVIPEPFLLAGDCHAHFSKSAPAVYRSIGAGIVSSERWLELELAREAGILILVKTGKWSDG